jgi:acyl carrier protein
MSPRPHSAAIAAWLRERLGQELGVRPDQIDLDRSPESYGIDSLVGAQVGADLGEWLVGHELPADALLAAPSLLAACERLAAEVASPAEHEPRPHAPLGAPLARLDHGERLVQLSRSTRVLAAGERHELARLEREPSLLTLAYRYVDEAGRVGGSTYYGGQHIDRIRPWVQTVASEDPQRFGVFCHNASDRTLEVTVVALAVEAP